MLTGRRFRVEFTDEQERFAEQIAHTCRAVWNVALEQRREYRRRGAWMNYRRQAAELAEAKTEHPWLAEAPAHCLQQTLMDLDKACNTHGTFRVRWRSSRRRRPSFRFPEGNKMVVERLNRRHGRVKLPKLGWVRFRLSRPLDDLSRPLDDEVIRSATLTREGAHWFVSFLVEDRNITPEVHALPATALGVDRGIAVAVATSDGLLRDRLFLTDHERRRVIRLQRRLSRSAKHGRNRAKTRAAISVIEGRERHHRQDFCAYTAHKLTTRNAVVAVEALRTKQITRSAKEPSKRPEPM